MLHNIDRSKLLPWSEKYRPNSIKNVIYHNKITNAIMNYMESNKRSISRN